MIPTPPRPASARFRRVVVAFDGASNEDPAAVEAAAAFAARLRTELFGLFIEDIDLARLAEHTGITTMGTLSAGARQMGAGLLKTALKAQLARTRQAVERAAARQRVRSTFEIRRGRIIPEIQSTAAPADLVIIGWRGRPAASIMAPGTPSAAVLTALCEGAARFVLVARRAAAPGGPLLVAYDGSAAAASGLAAAAEIGGGDGTIEVAVLAARIEDVESQRRAVGELLARTGSGGTIFQVTRAGLDELLAIARTRRAGLLVVPTGLLDAQGVRRIVERAPCSLLLVREADAGG
ncbi:MAG: universal stress protein [Rhodospirillales bacterium]|nr:universal stress protein [Rhodospirillales bacterium]